MLTLPKRIHLYVVLPAVVGFAVAGVLAFALGLYPAAVVAFVVGAAASAFLAVSAAVLAVAIALSVLFRAVAVLWRVVQDMGTWLDVDEGGGGGGDELDEGDPEVVYDAGRPAKVGPPLFGRGRN